MRRGTQASRNPEYNAGGIVASSSVPNTLTVGHSSATAPPQTDLEQDTMTTRCQTTDTILHSHGWFLGRSEVELAEKWTELLQAKAFVVNPFAKAIFLEFGGIVIPSDESVKPKRWEINIDPFYDFEDFYHLCSQAYGLPLCPVGMYDFYTYGYKLAVDPLGRVLLLDPLIPDSRCLYFADHWNAALDTMISNAPPVIAGRSVVRDFWDRSLSRFPNS